ncbi:AraC family transcriptional regulator [Hydrocarboniphaga sp.]|uniref:helix-turn-helix domain-containing protein n=1 Tax=Hydrocarboniphaga sp. TaxID=2033016 RepID=UPI00263684BA|nr:AraC family transcriptional regulator [Hydrocarboniphaga sp.]
MSAFADNFDPVRTLLARLETLATSGAAGDYSCITARREHGARSVDIDRPQLAILVKGRKQVRGAGLSLDLAAGEILLMARRCALDVVNVPDPVTGLYLTLMIPLCAEVVDATRLIWGRESPTAGDPIASIALRDLLAELDDWVRAVESGQMTDARLAMTAAMLRLCSLGHTGLLVPPSQTYADRIRERVRADPTRNWQSQDIEAAFGLSGATLRRRLADENHKLRDVIAHARLACALELLYTTRWPIKTVAARVGYQSVSSFVERFVERYGLDPGSIGNA